MRRLLSSEHGGGGGGREEGERRSEERGPSGRSLPPSCCPGTPFPLPPSLLVESRLRFGGGVCARSRVSASV